MNEKTQFTADFLREFDTIAELARQYDISHKTAHKWIDRYLRLGPGALQELPRKPHHSPNKPDSEIVTAFFELRRRHPTWGGKKLLEVVHRRHPRWDLPARTTVQDILKRSGMVPIRRWRRRIGHP